MAGTTGPLVFVHGLRGFAALLVVWTHLLPHLAAGGVATSDATSRAIASVGYIAVDIFFVTSGCMIWLITAGQSGWVDASRFLRRRFARIYAGYWPILALAAVLLVLYRPGAASGTRWWLSATLVPLPYDRTAAIVPEHLVIPVAWTLLFELWFYGLVALAIGTGMRRAATLAWSLAGIAVVGVIATRSGVFTPERMLDATLVPTLYLSPYIAEFVLGAIAAEYAIRRRVPLAWLVVACVLTTLVAWTNAHAGTGGLNSGPATPLRVLVAGPAAAAWLLGALALDQRGVRRGTAWLVPIGESTYAIYLLHTVVLTTVVASGLHAAMHARGVVVAGYLAILAATAAVAVLYTYAVDRPLYALFRTLVGLGKRAS